jgi:hypothetical protein
MSRDAAAAGVEVARLQALRDTAKEMKITYWADQIDILAEVVRGLASIVGGKKDEGLATLRAAADREDATEKHVVTPGLLVPAREVTRSRTCLPRMRCNVPSGNAFGACCVISMRDYGVPPSPRTVETQESTTWACRTRRGSSRSSVITSR